MSAQDQINELQAQKTPAANMREATDKYGEEMGMKTAYQTPEDLKRNAQIRQLKSLAPQAKADARTQRRG